jgi:hypothetical protein
MSVFMDGEPTQDDSACEKRAAARIPDFPELHNDVKLGNLGSRWNGARLVADQQEEKRVQVSAEAAEQVEVICSRGYAYVRVNDNCRSFCLYVRVLFCVYVHMYTHVPMHVCVLYACCMHAYTSKPHEPPFRSDKKQRAVTGDLLMRYHRPME